MEAITSYYDPFLIPQISEAKTREVKLGVWE